MGKIEDEGTVWIAGMPVPDGDGGVTPAIEVSIVNEEDEKASGYFYAKSEETVNELIAALEDMRERKFGSDNG